MMKLIIQNLAIKTTMLVATQTKADPGSTLAESIQWFIAGGGLLMGVWGIVQVVQSGRQGDSQGKMEGSWLILGGILLISIAAGTMISGVFSNPPGS